MINTQLRRDARADAPLSYYFIKPSRKKATPDAELAGDQALQRLRGEFPSLVFLQLDLSDERFGDDYDAYASLSEIILNAENH